MPRKAALGIQDFEEIRTKDIFYVDKTDLIREWWETGDKATLLTRPRRFGKTLNMSMLESFFLINMRGGAICLRDSLSGRRRDTAGCRAAIR